MTNLSADLSRDANNKPSVTVVIPVKDEQDTLARLAEGIFEAVSGHAKSAEIVFVDDGSKDKSWKVMQDLVLQHPGQVRALKLRRNFGKSIALAAGFKVAHGDVIFTMDADLQDDPKEIPRFLEALDGGLDLVSGWKRKRNDPLSKTLPSLLFNRATAWITGVPLHDFNCGFKAYRREVIEQLKLYGELHRYIPALANDAGFRIGEIEVEHHPRRHGVTKYGLERYVRGFLDLITILATTRYLQRPGHLFGGLGVGFGLLGSLVLGYLGVLWLMGQSIGHRPLFFAGILLMVFSVQMISLGVIAELLIRLSTPRDVGDLVVADVSERSTTKAIAE
ncbi:glycosyltransferase family 2 protein [Hyphomicrobium sp. LHD-15]|uniref:glycosyltransferase family 2 protein n=1 Tax=Hyphomicrobium sp. LHD-15 TaxID=3072142 RepID=UPI00280F2694|nr:glycosyltransferase family 2 protein [Hyphomicrobium sp. LHD-15]MDQ8699877.1 glycosyltransferase family 2 protein [Hyphomicrobium sp. LHD-15]